jgi:hypothetical protein
MQLKLIGAVLVAVGLGLGGCAGIGAPQGERPASAGELSLDARRSIMVGAAYGLAAGDALLCRVPVEADQIARRISSVQAALGRPPQEQELAETAFRLTSGRTVTQHATTANYCNPVKVAYIRRILRERLGADEIRREFTAPPPQVPPQAVIASTLYDAGTDCKVAGLVPQLNDGIRKAGERSGLSAADVTSVQRGFDYLRGRHLMRTAGRDVTCTDQKRASLDVMLTLYTATGEIQPEGAAAPPARNGSAGGGAPAPAAGN